MSAADFTVIDGIPKRILSSALKSSASAMLREALERLQKAGTKLERIARFDRNGQSRRMLELDELDAAIVDFRAARDAYAGDLALLTRVYETATDLEETDPPTPPPAEVSV